MLSSTLQPIEAVSACSNASLRARTLNLIQVKKELCNRIAAVMSDLGQKRTLRLVQTSALLPKADMRRITARKISGRESRGSIPLFQRGTLSEKTKQNQNPILAEGAQERGTEFQKIHSLRNFWCCRSGLN
jgi:hypothetical protein